MLHRSGRFECEGVSVMDMRFEKMHGIKLPDVKKDTEALTKEIALYMKSQVQKHIKSNTPPANAPLTVALKKGSQTLKDNGHLMTSISAGYSKHQAIVSTNLPYARLVNDGGTITAKNRKFLCIPASRKVKRDMLKVQGGGKESKGLIWKYLDSMRAKGYSVYRPYRKGTSTRANVIMGKKKDKDAEALFILKTSVKIPPRPYMYLSDRELKQIDKMVGAFYEK